MILAPLLYNNEWLGELGFKIIKIFYDPSQNVRAFGFRFHYSFPAKNPAWGIGDAVFGGEGLRRGVIRPP